MGVIGLLPWLKRRYTSAFSSGKKEKYDHIYTDSNAFLYRIAEITVDPMEIARMLLEVASEYHTIFGASIHIFLDGPPSMGKVRHQRIRRWRYPPLTVHENLDGSIGMWTPAIFTPGTPQMHIINKYVEDHMHEYPGLESFSSSDIPGEGEHKLIAAAKLLPHSARIALVSPDADMILLGMGMEKHNVSILRHWSEKEENLFRATHEMLHIDCPLLRSSIVADMKTNSIWNFSIATWLIGMDFLPPVPECSDIFKVLPRIIRKRIRVYDERTKSILWPGIFNLAQSLRGEQIDPKWVGNVSDSSIFDTLYYTKYLPFPVDKAKMVQQWIITIEWVFQYYHNGLDIASRAWQYNLNIAPSLSTIVDVGISSVKGLEVATEQVQPLTPAQALAAALPPWLTTLLPQEQRVNIKSYPEYYPMSFKVIEALDHPDIPTIPYEVASSL